MFIESQKMIIEFDEAPIDRLDPETSRGTVKERPYMFIEL